MKNAFKTKILTKMPFWRNKRTLIKIDETNLDNEENMKELEFVRDNIFTLYDWSCSLEDAIAKHKGTLEKLLSKFKK
jgi:hypothetical protein